MNRAPRFCPAWPWLLLLLLMLSGCAAKMTGAAAAPAVPPPPPPAQEKAAVEESAPASLDAAEGAPGADGAAGTMQSRSRLAQLSTEPSSSKKEAADAAAPAGEGRKPVSLMLIYEAQIVLGVFETNKGIDQVEKLATSLGGYLVSRDDQRITVRVPAQQFQGALDSVLKAGDVLSRNVSVRDVTREYYDLEVRLRNAEAMRQRLEQLLAKADKVEGALAVERELERVARELERLKGQLRLLAELAAFSTITVRFQPIGAEHVDTTFRLPFGWLDDLGLGNLLNLGGRP